MKIYLKYDGSLSLADSLSLQIMNEQNIREIVSFDIDFDKVKEIQKILICNIISVVTFKNTCFRY
jgi:predicted nucleic acid-binding protein